MAKENYRELHFSSKKEMRRYMAAHPNSTFISKKEYKKRRKQHFEEEQYRKRKNRERREKCEQFLDDVYNDLKSRYDAKDGVELCCKFLQDITARIEEVTKDLQNPK